MSHTGEVRQSCLGHVIFHTNVGASVFCCVTLQESIGPAHASESGRRDVVQDAALRTSTLAVERVALAAMDASSRLVQQARSHLQRLEDEAASLASKRRATTRCLMVENVMLKGGTCELDSKRALLVQATAITASCQVESDDAARFADAAVAAVQAFLPIVQVHAPTAKHQKTVSTQ